jgi:protein TonB
MNTTSVVPLTIVTLALLLAAPAMGASQTDQTVYSPGNGVTLPVVVTQVKPDYTNEAKDQRIQGSVQLECVVRPDARITDVTVVRSLDSEFGLDRQAMDALRRWEFRPGTKDDNPVAVRIAVEMTFSLK